MPFMLGIADKEYKEECGLLWTSLFKCMEGKDATLAINVLMELLAMLLIRTNLSANLDTVITSLRLRIKAHAEKIAGEEQ